jgi:hypothetical protein
MAMRRLLANAVFEPEEIAVLTAAYDDCVRRLQLNERDDPLNEVLAKRILEAARRGDRDHRALCEEAIRALGGPGSGSTHS